MKLYKFMKKEHAVCLLDYGIFRITTLFDCRNYEKHPHGIADKDEGTKQIYCMDPVVDSRDPDTPPALLEKLGISVDDTSVFRAEQSVFRHREENPDCYLFCLALDCNLEPWLEKFGYDTIVEIMEAEPFFQALTHCIFITGRIEPRAFMARCAYTTRSQYYKEDQGIPPALIKDPSFAYQQEVRAIWIPAQQPVEPFFIECPQAVTSCRILL